MGRSVLRKLAIVFGFASLAVTAPLAAQGFSDGYEFLKAVKDRDGDVATDMLNQPGTTIVNSRDITSGDTGLHIVVERRDVVWVQFLLQRGADPNIRNKRGVTPLQLAARLGFIEGVEELIKKGAEVDVTDRTGETPLMSAVHERNVPIIRLLLAKGADPDKNDNSGRSAREHASVLVGNSRVMAEFARADKEREDKGTNRSYGPSF